MVDVTIFRDRLHVIAYYITDEGKVHLSVAFTKRGAQKKLLTGGIGHASDDPINKKEKE